MARGLGTFAVLCNCSLEKSKGYGYQRQAQYSGEEIRNPIHRCANILMPQGSDAQPAFSSSEREQALVLQRETPSISFAC